MRPKPLKADSNLLRAKFLVKLLTSLNFSNAQLNLKPSIFLQLSRSLGECETPLLCQRLILGLRQHIPNLRQC